MLIVSLYERREREVLWEEMADIQLSASNSKTKSSTQSACFSSKTLNQPQIANDIGTYIRRYIPYLCMALHLSSLSHQTPCHSY